MTFQDRLRRATRTPMEKIGRWLWDKGVHPDFLTIIGLMVVVIASAFIATGHLQLAGVILIVGLPLDALDGAVARAMNQPNRRFGGIHDSSLDRYADGFIFGGLVMYFSLNGDQPEVLLCLLALVGAFTTSYVRARAGEAGLEVKVGGIDRLMRVALLLVALLAPTTLMVVLFFLAAAGNITTLQRLGYAWTHLE